MTKLQDEMGVFRDLVRTAIFGRDCQVMSVAHKALDEIMVAAHSLSQAPLGEEDRATAREEWRDISTAPMDGTRVDLWAERAGLMIGRERCCRSHWGFRAQPFGSLVGGKEWVDENLHPLINATHWMPVPNPPALLPSSEAGCRATAREEWQPIETAPKDGSAILLWSGALFDAYVGGWDTVGEVEKWIDFSTGEQERPTHWMPLPSPPVAGLPSSQPNRKQGV